MIVADLKGGENKAQEYAATLLRELVHDRDGVTVRAGGMAVAYAQINQQNERDLLLMESIAIPLSFAVLVGCWVAWWPQRCRSSLGHWPSSAPCRCCG